MDKNHRALRQRLQKMPPKQAVAYVLEFDLPPQEAFCIVECDIKKRSCVEVGQRLFVSPETVKRRRRSGYAKITM